MSILYERLKQLCEEKGINGAILCDEIGYKSHSLLTELKSGRKKTITAEVASDIANYFGVSVDYILGKTDNKGVSATDNDIKFALFGGDGEITDEMYNDVKKFAQFIKEKYENDKKE